MLYLSRTIFVYRFYKILVIEPTTEVKAESIGAPSVKEIETTRQSNHINLLCLFVSPQVKWQGETR
jgi:hypothetical protein